MEELEHRFEGGRGATHALSYLRYLFMRRGRRGMLRIAPRLCFLGSRHRRHLAPLAHVAVVAQAN